MVSAPWTAGSSYELDLDSAVEEIIRRRARRVGLQVPEGLKRAASSMAGELTMRTGAEVVISGDPCYGACDLDLALWQEVDLLIHLGHADMGVGPERVIYQEARSLADLRNAAEKAVPLLKARRVGVTTTVQHVHKLDQALEVLQEHGIEGALGLACPRTKYPGQVLGCCYCAARGLDVNEYLFFGTGQFHPLGVALATGKRVVAADPVTGEVQVVDTQPFLRQRYGAMARALDCKSFVVLVSKKPGQRRWELARRMVELGESKGKEMALVYLDNVEPDRLVNLGIGAAVSTACPRIALDDMAKFKIPVLTPPEFEMVVGDRTWKEYKFDGID